MPMSFSERADQLCENLRDIEHQSQEVDELFYCAYLLGLLGLYSSTEGEGQAEFDAGFHAVLIETLESENVDAADQASILTLWKQTSTKISSCDSLSD